MRTYRDLTQFFGHGLNDKNFQEFLAATFSDLTNYDILDTDYISSVSMGVDLGFTNNTAIVDHDDNMVENEGEPIFSHFILYPKSITIVNELPFNITFTDNRIKILEKAGQPIQTKQGNDDLLGKEFLVDSYKLENIIISYDYDPKESTINFIQVRDNNIVEHLRL